MTNGFDYSKYLRQKKICGIVKAEKVNILHQEKDFKYYLFKFKKKLLKIIEVNYKDEEIGFLKAILLGEISYLDEDIKENFRNANISHVLAISGMHISYIILGVESFLKIFVKDIKIRNIIVIIFLFIFVIFVGGTNSVTRACIMSVIAYLGKIFLRKDDFFTSFKVALSILLILNPYNIFSGSMWLSFGGSLGIVLYSKFLENIFFKILKRKLKNISNRNLIYNFFQKISSIISVTLSAQIIIFPIMIYIFNTFSFNFIISNLLISELIAPILIMGYLSLVFPFISILVKLIIKIMFIMVKFSSQIPLSQILITTPKLYKLIIYYVILLILYYCYSKSKFSFIRKIKKLKLHNCIIITILVVFVLFGNISIPYRKNFEIHFLDVGQGDSCIIRTRSNKTILIDGGNGNNGEYDYGKNVIGPYLLDHGITKLDYIIISHFDSDHCGGLFYIIENFKVKNIIIGKQYSSYTNLINFLEIKNVKKDKLFVAKSGDKIKLDEDTFIYVLFPNENNKIFENEINNNSLVFKLFYKNNSILFTGDIEEEAEKILVNLYGKNLKSDILKVAHHGSKTSTTLEFLNAVSPKIALIGVGKNNNFGHPSTEIIERLQEKNVKVYRTDKDGEICIFIKQ